MGTEREEFDDELLRDSERTDVPMVFRPIKLKMLEGREAGMTPEQRQRVAQIAAVQRRKFMRTAHAKRSH